MKKPFKQAKVATAKEAVNFLMSLDPDQMLEVAGFCAYQAIKKSKEEK